MNHESQPSVQGEDYNRGALVDLRLSDEQEAAAQALLTHWDENYPADFEFDPDTPFWTRGRVLVAVGACAVTLSCVASVAAELLSLR